MVDITVTKPFYSVLILAFACSALVAGAAVGLKPLQEANRQLDRQKNILYAAGLYEEGASVEKRFENIETRIIDLKTGKFVEEQKIEPRSYNQRKASYTEDLSRDIPAEKDIAGLGRQEKYSLVYLVKKDGKLSQVVVPVRGKGLWSTMYAYVAVDADLSTIRGVSFYEHGETPGLGGEVENRRWQSGWEGKKIYADDDSYALEVVKGGVDPSKPQAKYEIDGISGATLTSQGVEDLMKFWFGEHGFKPFFEQLEDKANG